MGSYKQDPRQLACPVCRAGNARILWKVDSRQAAQHFVLEERDRKRFLKLASHIEALWGGKTCEVAECESCGFCFSNPFIAGDKRFYELAYVRHEGGYPEWKWEFQLTYEALKKSAGPGRRLLEIGAGSGAFVKTIARDILQKENILCTEFSEYGVRTIREAGVTCLSADIRDLSSPEFREGFDAVCMFQVLEHMDRPDDLFQKLNWLTKKGGSLFIATPNPGRIRFNELNGALLDMPPNHIGRWNGKCLEEIGRRSGFRVEDVKVERLSVKSVINEFIVYRFLRNSQRRDSLGNRIRRIKNRRLLTIMQVIGLAINSMTAIPAIARMDSTLGDSQWVHMVKT